VDDVNSRQTISQFLQAVSERIPLDCDSWGLEDYAVTIADYEVFHYDIISAVCKDEDEVVIRPLSFAEVRARTLSGRAQITPDGRHLVDGVAFGRPLLKRPARPDVTIPPRKRQRTEDHNIAAGRRDDELASFAETDGEYDEDSEEDEEDEDYELDESEHNEEEEDLSEDEQEHMIEGRDHDRVDAAAWFDPDPSNEMRTATPLQRHRPAAPAALRTPGSDRRNSLPLSVMFADGVVPNTEPGLAIKIPAPADNELENTASNDSSSDSSTSAPEDSSSDSGSESEDSSDESANENHTNKRLSATTQDKAANSKSAKHKSLANASSRDGSATKSASQDVANNRVTPGAKASRPSGGLPFQGSTATKLRNQRRVESKRLTHLKKIGKLSAAATLEDLRAYSASNGQSDTNSPSHNDVVPTTAAVSSSATKTDLSKELERRRQKLLDDLASGGIDVSEDFGAAQKASPVDAVHHDMQTQEPISAIAVDQPSSNGAGSKRRAGLNVQSTNRMIFASLGLRTPKTAEERRLLQDKLQSSATRPTSEHVRDQTSSEPAQQAPTASALWTRRISLSAVECCDEGVVLSAPPFPFQQRWDPQYQTKKKRNGSLYSESRSKKRKGNKTGYVESYDKYNTDGYGDALDYDDPDGSAVDEYWEDGALLDGESGYDDNHEAEADPENSKFPTLPADVSSLPPHTEAVAKAGDIIVFTELACSAATNWQPRMVTRTALLHEKEEDYWSIQLAPRDLPPKKYDDDGNRVYEKFETMEDEEGDDDGRRTLGWAEMLEPRLLASRAPSVMES
jgi:hypothetical protein